MIDKNPESYSWVQYAGVLGISLLGGLVGMYHRWRTGQLNVVKPVWLFVIGELLSICLAGLLTFWTCEAYGMDGNLTAVFTALAGHVGGEAPKLVVEYIKRRSRSSGLDL